MALEYLEADFAQLEDINQIIQNNLNHDSWECFDTALLLEQHPEFGTYDSTNPKNSILTKTVRDVRYNSILVNNITEAGKHTYVFEVRNSLWDGTYKITKSKNTSNDADETYNTKDITIEQSDAHPNKLQISIPSTLANSIRVCFHMSMPGTGRTLPKATTTTVTQEEQISIRLDNKKEYEHQYNQAVKEEGHLYDGHNKPVTGATVSIEPCDKEGNIIKITQSNGKKQGNAIQSQTIKGITNGTFTMTYSAVDTPGDYYVLMKATYKTATTQQIIHIKKIQNNKLDITWGDTTQYKNVTKGSIHQYTIPITAKDQFGINDTSIDLTDLHVDVSFVPTVGTTRTQTCTVTKESNQYVIKPKISYRGYYEDYSMLKISIPAHNNYPATIKSRKVSHTWFLASNFKTLLSEVNNNEGTDYIFLKAAEYTVTEPLNITRPLTIAGVTGSKNCQLNGHNKNIIKINAPNPATDNYMKVQLKGIMLSNGQPAINMATGCKLIVDKCYFTGNQNPSLHHKGCSIYMPNDDKNMAKNNLWNLEVKNSVFYNNTGNEIQSIGTTLIYNNLFKTTSADKLQQPEVKVISALKGTVRYRYNLSYIKVPTRMKSNHSYAKALAYVGKTAKFNGVGPSQLKRDNSLPLYGSPYYNQAYTYAIYYYPYSNVRTTIVCYPRKGHEKQATGHASSAKNWVFYDGYDFVRWNNGRNVGNTTDPYKNSKLIELPTNQGIFHWDTKSFVAPGSDPRISLVTEAYRNRVNKL